MHGCGRAAETFVLDAMRVGVTGDSVGARVGTLVRRSNRPAAAAGKGRVGRRLGCHHRTVSFSPRPHGLHVLEAERLLVREPGRHGAPRVVARARAWQ